MVVDDRHGKELRPYRFQAQPGEPILDESGSGGAPGRTGAAVAESGQGAEGLRHARAGVRGGGRPDGLDKGYYVKPTVFANVSNDMTIAREEIFGPVLSMIPYDDEDEAIRIANDTPYGLSGYVSCADLDRARSIALRMRTGMVHINGAWLDSAAPFGGYKQSGNGREWGAHGIEEFLEVKSIYGFEKRQK